VPEQARPAVRTITGAGGQFNVHQWGEPGGAPVLLLHGFPEGAGCWQWVGPLLAADGAHVLAPDQRGYSPGTRAVDLAGYRLAELVADAAGLLAAVGWSSAHVVGHDWGAVIAWVLAAEQPARVRSLTAVSVPHPRAFVAALASDPDQRRRSQYLRLFALQPKAEQVLLADGAARLHAMFAGSGLDAATVSGLVEPLTAPGALTAALGWYRATGTSQLAAVPAVGVDTTFVWGNQDLAVSAAAANGAAEHCRGPYRFVELDAVSHWVPEQVPRTLAELVRQQVAGRLG
jgi:pimeloyl-ACP methyl ester carboxylesterase